MIHELIDPKKKTNKAAASRQVRTLLDNRPTTDHLPFYPSDSENKEVDASTTFIPPWLRNSLGLSQRHNQSHLTAGHSDHKSTKIIHRFKDSNQNEYDALKANEEDCCKNVQNQFESQCPQDEPTPENGTQERVETDEVLHREETTHWQVMSKESETDSSFPNTDRRDFEKEEQKMRNSELMAFAEIDKIRDEEKKKLRYFRQKNRLRRRGEQKTFEQSKGDAECVADAKGKDTMESCSKKIMHTVTSDVRQFETKFLLLQKSHGGKIPRLSQQELRLLQDIKEQVGSIGDFDALLDRNREIHSRDLIKATNFLTNEDGDKKIDDSVLQKYNEDIKADADKDSLLSTDDEHDIKRFSEFLSKNKNAEEKRKCLEEVRNYFERKRKTRLSKRRYLDNLKAKLPPENDRKEEHKDRLKCRELTMILPNRGKRSKFALCDEEVVERAVDETLQKFMELYHFHVSPTVMGNMKKNILQAMQSDSMDSSGSKMNLEREKPTGKQSRNDLFTATKESPRREVQCSYPVRTDVLEVPNNEMAVLKEVKKKTFNALLASSNEQLLNQSKEIDILDDERLKRLNKEFEIFLRSVQGHLDVSRLKIQSIILEDEETNPSKHVQFVYNFSKKGLETEKSGSTIREAQGLRALKEVGVQANLKKEPTKKNIRIQVVECKDKSDKDLQTDLRTYATEGSQTEGGHVTIRELKELKSLDINPGLYRMVKSKEAGKFYLYPEQLESSKAQSFAKSDTSVLKEKKITKKELLSILSKERNKERRLCLREKEKAKSKKTKKVFCTSSYLKAGIRRRDRDTKKRPLDLKRKDLTDNDGSVNCLYFRNLEGKGSETRPSEKEPPARKESTPETAEKLGVGDMKEEHLGCVWLWNGEKISPGCDLKTHVENLLKEKLKEMTDIDTLQKNLLERDLTRHTSDTKTFQKSVFPKGLNLSKPNLDVLAGIEEPHKTSEKKKSNPVFCYTNYNNVNTENDPTLQFRTENENAERMEKNFMKKMEEPRELKSSSFSQEKLVRNVGTQNSQQRFLSINLGKSRTRSKSTVAITKKKEAKRTSSVKPIPRKLVNFRKAEGIIRAVEEIKKIQMELEGVRKSDSKDSDSMLDPSSSSYESKNENEDTLSLVLGICEGRSRPEETSGSPVRTVKSRIRKMMDLMNHEAKTKSVEDFEDANSEESRNEEQLSGSRRHVELIEDFLCKVSQKERESLWNDIRDFIKTKIGRDINDDGAKEVCIEIEQDLPKNEHGAMKQAVLARGHYMRNEGDVEVEIDLTLEDLEKILRQRQKRIRKQRLCRKRYKRFISSSSVQSDLTKEEMKKYHRYLNRVATLGGSFVTDNPTGSLKKNKGN